MLRFRALILTGITSSVLGLLGIGSVDCMATADRPEPASVAHSSVSGKSSSKDVDTDAACKTTEPDWEPSEQEMWVSICQTGVNDSYRLGNESPDNLDDCPSPFHVSAKFLSTLLSKNPYKKRLSETGLRLTGIGVDGPLYIDTQSIPGGLKFACFEFMDRVALINTTVNGSVEFVTGKFHRRVDIDGSTIKGFLTLRNIEGTNFSARRARIERDVLLEGGFSGEVSLPEADVHSFYFEGHSRELGAPQIKASGNIEIHADVRKSENKVDFTQATVDGNFNFYESIIDSPLGLSQAHIKGNLFLSLFSPDGINAKGLKVDDALSLSTPLSKSREIDANQEALIKSDVFKFLRGIATGDSFPATLPLLGKLFEEHCSFETNWNPGAIIVLNDARIHIIESEGRTSLESWPVLIGVSNLTFDILRESDDLTERNNLVDWYGCWLRRGVFFSGRLDQRDYQQIATYLRARGDNASADVINIKGKDRETSQTCSDGWRYVIDCGYLVLSWALVGYGYRMYLPIVYLLLFVIFGAIALRHPYTKTYPDDFVGPPAPLPLGRRLLYGLGFSLDMFLPLIRLDEAHYENTSIHGWRRGYLYAHKCIGWLLSAYVVAAVTGLTK